MSKEFEKARATAIRALIIKIAVCAVIGCLGFLTGAEENIALAFIMYAVAFGIGWWAYSILAKNRAYAKFVSIYKKEMIEMALNGSLLFDEMNFEYDCGINPDAVDESGLISTEKFFSDCLIRGSYNGVPFIQADVRNLRGEKGRYSLEYDGTYAIIPTNLPSSVQTNIADRKVDISYIVSGKSYSTGNTEFDQSFKIYSTDHNSAAQLLTSSVTNKLMNIRNSMNGSMAIAVKNGNMYIFMSRKDSPLKPNLFKKYDDEMRQSIISELSRIKLFINAFSV